MTIAFNTFSGGVSTGVTSKTLAHTCSGSNRVLIVGVVGNQNPDDFITGATYNGVAMTLLETINPGNGSDRYGYLFYLSNPALGTNDIVVSASASSLISIQAVSYTGCLQDVADAHNQSSSATSATTYNSSLTTVADNCWVVSMVACTGVGAYSAGADTAYRGANYNAILDSNDLVTPAGSRTLNYVKANAGSWRALMVSLAPAQEPKGKNFAQII